MVDCFYVVSLARIFLVSCCFFRIIFYLFKLVYYVAGFNERGVCSIFGHLV